MILITNVELKSVAKQLTTLNSTGEQKKALESALL